MPAGSLYVILASRKKSWLGEPPAVMALEKKDFSILPKKKSHSNKGSYGKLLLIAGSVNMAGAAVLSLRKQLMPQGVVWCVC